MNQAGQRDRPAANTTTRRWGGVESEVRVVGAGPAVLLVHGSADGAGCWAKVAALLAPTRTVWMPTLPPLAWPRDGGPARALDVDLPWLADGLADSGARLLAGHSYGALLALRAALAHPDGLDGLLLCEPIAWGVLAGDGVANRLGELEARCLAPMAAGAVDDALRWLVDFWNGDGYFDRLPPRVIAALHAGAARTAAEVQSGADDGTDARALAVFAAAGLPLRLLAGADTTAESLRASAAIAAAVPGAALRVIAGAGHQFPRSHPEVVAAAIAALASL